MKEISLEAAKNVSGGFAYELLQNGALNPATYFLTMIEGVYQVCMSLSESGICWPITEEMFKLFNSTLG